MQRESVAIGATVFAARRRRHWRCAAEVVPRARRRRHVVRNAVWHVTLVRRPQLRAPPEAATPAGAAPAEIRSRSRRTHPARPSRRPWRRLLIRRETARWRTRSRRLALFGRQGILKLLDCGRTIAVHARPRVAESSVQVRVRRWRRSWHARVVHGRPDARVIHRRPCPTRSSHVHVLARQAPGWAG